MRAFAFGAVLTIMRRIYSIPSPFSGWLEARPVLSYPVRLTSKGATHRVVRRDGRSPDFFLKM